MDDERITVTKLDAALRQYRTAIRLWFSDGDPVSIHTLLAAAHEIIHTLFRRKGLRDLMFDSVRIRDERRAEWIWALKEPPNFFKHAREDPEGTIKFSPDLNPMLMLMLAKGLGRMGIEEGPEEAAIVRWLWINDPKLFMEMPDVPADSLQELRSFKKEEFWKYFEPLWPKMKERYG